MDARLEQNIEECAKIFSKRAIDIDLQATFPRENFEVLQDNHLLELAAGESFGGHRAALGGDHHLYVEVLSKLSSACPNTGHCFETHCWSLSTIRLLGTEEQHEFFANEAANGAIFANFGSEPDQEFTSEGERVEYNTTARRESDGWLINGQKFFATNSTHADYQTVYALPEGGELEDLLVPVISADADGVEVHDTWEGMGQRATASGMVEYDDVFVPDEHVVGAPGAIIDYGHVGTGSGLIFSAILLGIGQGALDFVKWWLDEESKAPSDLDSLAEDPHVQLRIGNMDILLTAAAELMNRAADTLERAETLNDPDLDARAKADAFRARVFTTRASLSAANKLFQLTGARSTSREFGGDLYWRSARTLSLHDVVDKQTTDIARHVLGIEGRGGFAR